MLCSCDVYHSFAAVLAAGANLEENLDRRGEKEGTLRALMTVGMSEQTAREQIMRLAAGDIWAG